MTPASIEAMEILRSPDQFHWSLLFGLGLVMWAYAAEIRAKNWDAVLMGLLFSAGEMIWEMINSLILHFTGFAGLWTTPGDTSFLILSGINIEIFLLFSLAGVVLVKLLQTFDDAPDTKILGLNYRVFIPLALGLFSTAVECALNRAGALVWVYRFWNWPHIWIILINYCLPYFLCTWGHYNISRQGKIRIFWILAAVNIVFWVVFVNVLGWI